jgi:hypothetical protein
MTPRTRELIFQVANGNEKALRPLHLFSRLSYCDTVFIRLISQNIIGQKFVDWYYKDMGASFLACVSYLMNDNGPVIVGKDFI